MMICDRLWAVIGRRVAWWLLSSLLQRRTSAALIQAAWGPKTLWIVFLKRKGIMMGYELHSHSCRLTGLLTKHRSLGVDRAPVPKLFRKRVSWISYSIPSPESNESVPWYRRIFRHPVPPVSEESNDSDEDEIPDLTVLEARNLHKTYLLGLEGVPALRGVNLRISRGEFVIIVGKSGSGKSSLLNILGTVDSPTRGELEISGLLFNDKTQDKTVSQIRLRSIGFVFQTFNLIPGMTAAQNVELPLILKVVYW